MGLDIIKSPCQDQQGYAAIPRQCLSPAWLGESHPQEKAGWLCGCETRLGQSALLQCLKIIYILCG